jgi:hypothetical protein
MNVGVEYNQKLIDAVSKKERLTIRERNLTCNNKGEIELRINPAFKPRRSDASFYISLISFATTNLIANVTEKNNKFRYSNATGVQKVITVPVGFYLIKSYNDEVRRQIKLNNDDEDAVSITINESTGIVCITLSKGYRIDFSQTSGVNHVDTFRKELGFNAGTLTGDIIHYASRVCDLWPTQSIYVHCSVAKGNKLVTTEGCNESDILYDFPCNQAYGAPITYQLSPRLTESDLDLSSGQIDKIKIKFTDDNNEPVTFGGSKVSLALRICQV